MRTLWPFSVPSSNQKVMKLLLPTYWTSNSRHGRPAGGKRLVARRRSMLVLGPQTQDLFGEFLFGLS
jgi:hypothetical protein